jgi:hypothetical protein
MIKVVEPWLNFLMVDLLPRRPDFIPRPILVWFVLKKLAPRVGFQKVYFHSTEALFSLIHSSIATLYNPKN